jgi:hypothetical protein
MGHVPFGLHRLIPNPCAYITILRNPLDRVISHYYYVKERGPSHYLYDATIARGMSLVDYATTPLDVELDNGQTRFISGIWSATASRREMLQTAKSNLLDHFVAFGVVERFAETVSLFRQVLGWSSSELTHENVTRTKPQRAEIDPGTLRRIEEFNALDCELYAWSTARFEEMLEKHCPAERLE